MGGGAWPFLVGGAICLVNSDNERDSSLLTSSPVAVSTQPVRNFLEGRVAFSHTRLSNNRSVMPLDVRGRTRATLKESAGLSWSGMTGQPVESPSYLEPWRVISHVNEESLVSANHELVLITSLPFEPIIALPTLSQERRTSDPTGAQHWSLPRMTDGTDQRDPSGGSAANPSTCRYLVDSASSCMLVLKIKPCKPKFSLPCKCETAYGSLNQ